LDDKTCEYLVKIKFLRIILDLKYTTSIYGLTHSADDKDRFLETLDLCMTSPQFIYIIKSTYTKDNNVMSVARYRYPLQNYVISDDELNEKLLLSG